MGSHCPVGKQWEIVVIEQHRHSEKRYAQRQQQPCQPGCGPGAHPTDSSTLVLCARYHNSTLQHYRLSKRYDNRYEDYFLSRRYFLLVPPEVNDSSQTRAPSPSRPE